MRTEQFEKLHLTFTTDPDDPGLHGESLWGERVDARRFRIANVPLAFGYNLGDIVFVEPEDGMLEIKGVSIRSGHSKVYIFAEKKGAAADARRKALSDDLASLGVTMEGMHEMWLLDIGPKVDRVRLERRLADAEAAGLVTWEADD